MVETSAMILPMEMSGTLLRVHPAGSAEKTNHRSVITVFNIWDISKLVQGAKVPHPLSHDAGLSDCNAYHSLCQLLGNV
jgi:hypothetical protein